MSISSVVIPIVEGGVRSKRFIILFRKSSAMDGGIVSMEIGVDG